MKYTALDDGCVDIAYLRTQLVLDALVMAIWQRRPKEVIHHSDQDSQYTLLAFGKHCREAGIGRRLFRQRPVRELFRHPGM